jgi:acyl-CoA thioester hydrolase
MNDKEIMHQIFMEVRDYECDIQGVVNNAVYLNYFEHARHILLTEKAVSFTTLQAQGINAVVYSSKVNYLFPLRPGNKFAITTSVTHSKLKLIFEQSLFLIENNKRCCEAIFEVVFLDSQWRVLKDRTKIEWMSEQLK